MLLLKRSGARLDRDIIFLAEAGEEGSTKFGIDYMVTQHWPEIDAEYAIAEGGYIMLRAGQARFVEVTTTEKVPRGMRLIAHGTAGHGSVPRLDNAVVRIANAVARIGSWQPPPRLNETTRAYFERLATISSPEQAARYNPRDRLVCSEVFRGIRAGTLLDYANFCGADHHPGGIPE